MLLCFDPTTKSTIKIIYLSEHCTQDYSYINAKCIGDSFLNMLTATK